MERPGCHLTRMVPQPEAGGQAGHLAGGSGADEQRGRAGMSHVRDPCRKWNCPSRAGRPEALLGQGPEVLAGPKWHPGPVGPGAGLVPAPRAARRGRILHVSQSRQRICKKLPG